MAALMRTSLAVAPDDEAGAPAHEFVLSDADFSDLVRLAYQHSGIALADSKRNLVHSRVSRRLRALRLPSFAAYRDHLTSEGGAAEIEHFVNAISTNLTRFFRETHHFDHLRQHVAEPFARHAGANARRLRIWSAGCSTGEEPYSIALVLNQAIPEAARGDVRVLATDIDTNVLATAAKGEYALDSLQEVPPEGQALIRAGARRSADRFRIDDFVRALVAFKPLNLMNDWPMQGPFDAVFCRNVMIYFDAPTKRTLVERLARMLRPGGWLYIGHSESLHGEHEACSWSAARPIESAVDPVFVDPLTRAAAPRSLEPRGGPGRFYDTVSGSWMVKVNPGDFYVTGSADETIVTTLGSCVAACIRDPGAGWGGLNHFMLPESRGGRWGGEMESTRFGNFAMEKLINALLKCGCRRERLEIKVFGGANVIDSQQAVGTQNAAFVLRYLADEGLRCVAQDLGGEAPRRIQYAPTTGRVIRRLLGRNDAGVVARDESAYATTLRSDSARPGEIELFGDHR